MTALPALAARASMSSMIAKYVISEVCDRTMSMIGSIGFWFIGAGVGAKAIGEFPIRQSGDLPEFR